MVSCGGGTTSQNPSTSSNGDTSSTTTSNATTSSGTTTSSAGTTSETTTSETTTSTTTSELVEPEAEVKTIDELVTNIPTSNAKMYNVTGVWNPTGNSSDIFGNGYLIDPTSGNQIKIYGLAPEKSAFTYSAAGYTFKNPKSYQTIFGTSFNAGDSITLGVVYSPDYSNYYSYFISKEADSSTFTYNVTLGTFENGTVTADKTSGVYGEKVTLTISPNENYVVESVKVNGDAISPVDGVYSFNIVPVKNEVTATFISSDVKITSMNLTTETLGLPTSYPSSEIEVKAIDGLNKVTFKTTMANYGNGIQSRIKDGNPTTLYNTTEFLGEIESITIVANSNWTSATSALAVTFGTEMITTAGTSSSKNQLLKTTTTINCDVAGAKFIRFDHSVKGGVYIDSITVNFKTAE